ncbi:MAG: cytochrome b [Pseudomonadota bacterium]
MTMMNTREGWGLVHRLMHWAAAIVILFQLAMGLYMVNVVTDLYDRFAYTQTHKSWGFVAFVLVLARIAWRWKNPRPDPVEMPRWQHTASEGAHIALYVLMIVLPVSGWLMSSASPLQDLYGVKNMVFGVFELPDPFVPGSDPLDKALKAVHFYAGIAMLLIIGVHVAAAMKHHFVDRDGLLRRMVFGIAAPATADLAGDHGPDHSAVPERGLRSR